MDQSNQSAQTDLAKFASILFTDQSYLAGILAIANEAIITIDQTQRILRFNQGAEQIFGYQPEEVINQSLDCLLPEPLIANHRRHIDQFAAGAETARLMGSRQTILGRRKNGETFPAEASIAKTVVNGTLILTVILRDITQRQAVEAERAQLIEPLQALDEATQAIRSRLSLEQVLQTITQAAQTLLKAKYAAVGLGDGRGRLTRFITAGLSQAASERIGALPIGRGLLGDLLRAGQALLLNDLPHDPIFSGFPAHHPPMRKLLGVPIFTEDG
jgi:PAS domain S-box-containing protein